MFEGKFLHPNTLYVEAVSACEDYYSSNELTMPPNSAMVEEQTLYQVWKAPTTGLIKINWDAALNKSTGCIGFGCVARDWMGEFLGAKCYFQRIMVDPKMAEMM